MTVETYGLISLFPALLAIILTLVTRQVLLSLFAGIWIGATVLTGWNPAAGATRSLQFVVDNVTQVRGESPAVHGGDESDNPSTNYVRRAERIFK